MKKITVGDVEAFAHKLLWNYFCESNQDLLISCFAEDIVWLGGGEKQKAEGREAVTKFFQKGKDEMIAFHMSDEEYVTRDLGGGYYLCEGISTLQSKEGLQMFMRTVQRITFLFREEKGELKAVHIHNSIPFQAMEDEELFPVKAF